MVKTEKIQEDFDHIAILLEKEGEQIAPYDDFVLKFVPNQCNHAMEVGCGTGTFTRLLAKQTKQVTAIDLSSEMIRVAQSRSTKFTNIDYKVGDFFNLDLKLAHFDCIVMIATLHHLPNEQVLKRVKQLLAPNGVLILHDILRPEGKFEKLANLVRVPVSLFSRYFRTGKPQVSWQLRKAWAEHGKDEYYLSKREVKAMSNAHLKGNYTKFHLLWRYTVIWRNQNTA